MSDSRFREITQTEAALAEELGTSPLDLDYTEDGKIIDFLDGTLLEDRPEERRRQKYIRQLHVEYSYPKEQMKREVAINIGRSQPVFADIVIYRNIDAAKRKDQGQIRFCVEVKAESQKGGHNQLVSYVFTTSSEGAVWTNGDTIKYYRRFDSPEHRLEPWNGIPSKAETWDSLGRLSKDLLIHPTDIKGLLRKCHQKLFRAGIESEDLAMDIVRIILAKWRDEISTQPQTRFYVTPDEYRSAKGRKDVAIRVQELFAEVRNQNLDVFETDESINAPDEQIVDVVIELQRYRLLVDEEQWWDILGMAYEQYTAAHFRQNNGQFFTNRLIIHMMVEMIDPDSDDVVLDPAGGSGGFVTAAVRHIRQRMTAQGLTSTARQKMIDDVRRSIGLIEKAPRLVKVAKTAAILTGDGHENFYSGDSLLPLTDEHFPLSFLNRFGNERPTVIMTNPPYAGTTEGKITDSDILSQFDVAKIWESDKKGVSHPTTKLINGGVPPELLFLERCLSWLKPGGRLGIVIAQGMLDTVTALSTRRHMFCNANLCAVISLHKNSFQPHTGVRTCVLILEKPLKSEKIKLNYPIFMAISRKIGQDSEGEPIFKRDEDGNETIELDHDLDEILASYKEFRKGKLSPSEYIFSVKKSELDQISLNINPQNHLPAFNESIRTVLQIGNQEGWSINTIGTIGGKSRRVYKGARFKRQNLETKETTGKCIEPYFTPSALLQDRVDSIKFLDLSKATGKQKILITKSRGEEGELLVTRSGSIGRVIYLTKQFNGKLISDDFIHILIDDKLLRMYVYIMLKTKLGQHQMLKNEYGSVQTHLEPAHIRNVIIPIPDDRKKLKKMVENMRNSIEAKEKSLDLERLAINGWQELIGIST